MILYYFYVSNPLREFFNTLLKCLLQNEDFHSITAILKENKSKIAHFMLHDNQSINHYKNTKC
jgi:hypothetical protein